MSRTFLDLKQFSVSRPARRPEVENTIWAYRHAFAYDLDFVEIDVRETLDGVFVSMHDDTLDPHHERGQADH